MRPAFVFLYAPMAGAPSGLDRADRGKRSLLGHGEKYRVELTLEATGRLDHYAPEAQGRGDRFVQAYHRLKILAAVMLCGYALAAVAIKAAFRHEREVFPLFSWSLYSTVPREEADYGVRILAVGGQTVDPPLFFEDARSFFPYVNQSQLMMTVQPLGRALDSGNTEAAARYRLLLERHHLRGRGVVHYEIARRAFNTLARWTTGRFSVVRSVGTFSTEGQAR